MLILGRLPVIWTVPLLSVCLAVLLARPASAQEETVETPAVEDASLKETQQSIAARYQRFSKTLAQLHGYMKETDPARAELLMRVIGKSNEARIDGQMDVLLELLTAETPQYAGVVERQEDLIESLLTLLDVLQSEDELERLGSEIERLQALIGDLNKLVIQQKEVRAGTERGRPGQSLQQDQQDVTENTQKLAEKIDKQDEQRREEAEKAGGDQKSQEGSESKDSEKSEQNGEKKPSEQNGEQKPKESDPKNTESMPKEGEQSPSQGESSDSESKPSEPQDSKQSPSQQQQKQQGQPQDQQPSEGSEQDQQNSEQQQQQKPQDQQQTAGREEVESAIERMQKAIDELKKEQKDNASREQDRAIAELEKAKAQLEEILRQLREEEQKIMLAALEARFRKMLQLQMAVRKASGQIHDIPAEQRVPRHRARSTQLARDEQDIVVEADKALVLFREEGTSVAFPEAVLELREDMRTVAERLNKFQIDDITIAIEDDIIEALEEMVEALRREMEKLEEKDEQGDQQQGEQGDPALIDLIAELKLLRSLQYRVNRRTRQYGRQIDGEQAADQELLDLLDQLSIRQARIQRATYDLSTGRNE
ncbi:hypothetical protein [Rubinisphaera margarita]|uniref:hypothetical protein n=1 Tax=Rubinisphaera margarita TaxID=2909586 RepID=UPI001EE80054|nr:hypothetical protein [Rubinisphaera margarita]MCG6156298.1 hypothetical protein [Rubinisphaera margarita]